MNRICVLLVTALLLVSCGPYGKLSKGGDPRLTTVTWIGETDAGSLFRIDTPMSVVGTADYKMRSSFVIDAGLSLEEVTLLYSKPRAPMAITR